ncbi:MAG: alpha/beta fold hydrolase [Byssovorax sp.]
MRRPVATSLLLLALVAGAACTPEPMMPPTTPTSPADGSHATPPGPSRPSILGAEASPIDFERIARFPEPGLQIPRAVGFSPDSERITYLQSESQGAEMALFGFDLATQKASVLVRASDLHKEDRPLSREEELRRERQRQKTSGITGYSWAKRADVMVIPHGGDLFVRGAGGVVTRLTDSKEPAIDPQLCPDGSQIAFVRKGELAVIDVKTKKETTLTQGAPEGVTRGLSDFIGQEELDEPHGLWWSPTCDRILYLEVDERSVDLVPVMGFRGGKPDLMQQRYPRAGTKNATVKPGIIDPKTRKTIWLKTPPGDRYFGRFTFLPDGKSLVFQSLTRDQKTLSFLRADVATGDVTELWTETSPTWVTYEDVHALERSATLLATAISGGHIHLETRDPKTGKRLAELTRGDWDVDHVAGVDEEKGLVYFVGTMTSKVESHLYSVPLAGGTIEKITAERGVHAVTMSRDGKSWVDVHSASDRMPRAVVHGGAGGAVKGELAIPHEAGIDKLRLRSPKIVTVESDAGDTLYGEILEPRTMEPGKRYPVIVMVYGGPGVQLVRDEWAPHLLWQHLADRGFVVFQLDNRGSAGRGPAFEAPIHKRMGEVELKDQLAGLDYLKTLPFVDTDRAGIYGHSYGGFMAALALLKAPDRFKVGVSGSPVTEWGRYDTGYTERYMATPAENPAGYAAADLAKMAKNLRGKLFLIHAMMDENVHFENSAHLIDALVEADKKFDLFVFPGERHGYRSPAARKYAMRLVVDYFVDNL